VEERVADEAVERAVAEAADEHGLPDYYRSMVLPLVRDREGPWPRCCGGGCDPCADDLVAVAESALRKLGLRRKSPIPW
jgi:hypothetical protein